ncbi:MAG: NADH-quinone oxidoreductase subunit J [Verrucomicrobia bacterium]|nr:NADH-quinone oxidoreductase subunit J [Verrucomicrobiota bacterium]MBI3869976.1 NADH-quinone oxidoreductase subunit J [Verrucomicrobiota bacterium]
MNGLTIILSLLVIASALGAVALRNLVHCALCLMGVFLGLAAIYLCLDAQFVGLVQILVYVGAVGILLVFAILLTRGGGAELSPFFSPSWAIGAGAAALLALIMVAAILKTDSLPAPDAGGAELPTLAQIGKRLMQEDVIVLEAMGLLLTAAAVGAIVLAMPEPPPKKEEEA